MAPPKLQLLHGIVHAEFTEYAIARLGIEPWREIVARAGLSHRTYHVAESYPDVELLGLVLGVSRATGEPIDAVLRSFGEAVVPNLLATYGSFIDSGWDAADVLANVERVIHRTIRLQDPRASPPYLTAERRGPHDVAIHYTSPRRLCAFGKGLVHGIAAHYQQTATIDDEACMHQGDDACVLRVRLTRVQSDAGGVSGGS